MCTILGLTPAQHNGSFDNVKDMLVDDYVPMSNEELIIYINVKSYLRNVSTLNFLFVFIFILLFYYMKLAFFKKKTNQLSIRAHPIKKINF